MVKNKILQDLPEVYGEKAKKYVFVVALTSKQEIFLIHKMYYPLGPVWEIPNAAVKGTVLDSAKNQLMIDANASADKWREIGKIQGVRNIPQAKGQVFLAMDCHAQTSKGKNMRVPETNGPKKWKMEKIKLMIQQGKINRREIIEAINMADSFLKKKV